MSPSQPPPVLTPLVQVALDVIDPDDAERLADDALAAGADWLEVGKPFVEFNGMRGAERLIARHPDAYWLLDLMIIAGSRRYVTTTADIGARNVTVTALAPDVTVAEACQLGRDLGVDITIDLFNVADLTRAAVQAAAHDPAYLMVHFGIDQKRANPAASPIDGLRAVAQNVTLPLSYATYDADEATRAIQAGASIIVQGEPLLSSTHPRQALTEFITRVKSRSWAS